MRVRAEKCVSPPMNKPCTWWSVSFSCGCLFQGRKKLQPQSIIIKGSRSPDLLSKRDRPRSGHHPCNHHLVRLGPPHRFTFSHSDLDPKKAGRSLTAQTLSLEAGHAPSWRGLSIRDGRGSVLSHCLRSSRFGYGRCYRCARRFSGGGLSLVTLE